MPVSLETSEKSRNSCQKVNSAGLVTLLPLEDSVPEFPETKDSLIVRVQKRTDQPAWIEFERIYRPVIFRIARARGLHYADAMDVVQQVLMSVANSINRYEKRDES